MVDQKAIQWLRTLSDELLNRMRNSVVGDWRAAIDDEIARRGKAAA